ncbi:MAG: tape measure protein [Rubrivivax sp.]|jgi:tape measure domain-containing protein|nr:tape measure protein [Rubrivivax sp.]
MTFNVETRFTATGVETAKRQVDEYGRSLLGAQDAADRMSTALTGALSRVGLFGGGILLGLPALSGLITQAIGAADAVTTLRNRLELATGSNARAVQVFDELFAVAQRSRTSFTELGSVYATMARAGYANITVVQAIGNAMAVGGGSAEGMRAALVQLGQGMAAGALRGEELNSVMEQAPRLAQALADGLGVPIGSLRRLGEQGELTAQKVVDALTKSAPKLAEEVARSTATVSQGFTVLGNATTRFIADADKATGFTRALSQAVIGLAEGIDGLGNIIRNNETAFSLFATGALGVGAAVGVLAVGKAVAMLSGTVVALGTALAASPAVLALLGIGAVGGGAVALGRAYARTEDGIASAIRSLEQQNAGSAEALRRAEDGGRTAGAATIRATMQQRIDQIRELRAEMALLSGQGLDSRAEDARFQALREQFDQQEKGRARVAEITRQLNGGDQKYAKTVSELAQLLAAGALTYQEYVALKTKAYEATGALGKAEKDRLATAKRQQEQADAETKQLKDLVEWRYEQTKAQQAQLRRYEEAELAIDASLKKGDEQVASIREETRLLTLNNVERETAVALRQLEAAGIAKGTYAYEEYSKRIREAIVDRESVRESVERVREIGAQWKRMSDEIGQALTDALFRAFESGGNAFSKLWASIRNLVRSTVLRVVLQPVQAGVANFVGGVMGYPMGAQGAGGGNTGMQALQLASFGQGLQNAWGSYMGASSSVGTWAQQAYLRYTGTQATNSVLADSAAGSAGYGASSASGGAAAGSWGAYSSTAAAAIAGHYMGRGISSGYSTGGSGNSMVNAGTSIGTAIGAYFGYPQAGAAIGGAIGGAVNRAFGRRDPQVVGQGVEASFGGGEFTGNAYFDMRAKGGWFRSDKNWTDRAGVGTELADVFNAGAKAVYEQAKRYGEALGLPVEQLASIRTSARIQFTGDAKADEQATVAALSAYGDALSAGYSQMLATFQRVGESMTQTLQRLGVLQGFSSSLNELGGVFSRVARLSIDAREGFIAMAGGMDALQAQALGFAQEYYSREEIAGLKARELQGVLASVGVNQDVNSREQFRALVDAADVSTEAGRRQLAALLGVAGDATGVFDYLQETGGTLSGAASQAPATTALGTLFGATNGEAQIDAINGVTTSVNGVRSAIEVLTDVTRGLLGSERARLPASREVVQP